MQHEKQIRKSEEVVDLFRKYLTSKERKGQTRQEVIHDLYFKLKLKLPSVTSKTFANQALGLTKLSYDLGIPLVGFLIEWEQQQKEKENKNETRTQ